MAVIKMQAVVLKIQRFDGNVTDSETGLVSSIENSCKIFTIGNYMTEEDSNVSEKSVYEQFGYQVDEFKLEHQVFEKLKGQQFPFKATLGLKSAGKRFVVNDVEAIKPITL